MHGEHGVKQGERKRFTSNSYVEFHTKSALSMYLQCSLAVYYEYTVHVASTTDSLFLWHGCLYEGMFVSCYSSTCLPAA